MATSIFPALQIQPPASPIQQIAPLGASGGQYRNAQGNRMQVGQEAYDASTKRYIGTVARVYPDGSYDVQ